MWNYRLPLFLALAAALPPLDAHARKCPNILFVVDHSGSMLQKPDGGAAKPGAGESKWELTQLAITQTLQTYGDQIPFGIELFGATDGACWDQAQIQVRVQHDQQAAILRALAPPPAGGSLYTNTSEAILRAYTEGGLRDPTRENVIVLITDGLPNCSGAKLGGSEPGATVTAITNAFHLGIHTFVVAFDVGFTPQAVQNLNDMAKAGGEPQPGCAVNKPCYYSAQNQLAFAAAIAAILGALSGNSTNGSCDDTCFSGGCPADQVCGIPDGGTSPQCMRDACLRVQCDATTYCKDGNCYSVCTPCGPGKKCIEGECRADPCDGKICAANEVCDPVHGCVTDKCAATHKICPPSTPLFCDSISGNCVDDPCRRVNCPPGASCLGGYCMTDLVASPPDMSVGTDDWLAPGPADSAVQTERPPRPGVCSLGGGRNGAGGTLLFAIALGGMIVARRRRRSRS